MIHKGLIVLFLFGLILTGIPLVLFPSNKAVQIFCTTESPDYTWLNRANVYRTEITMDLHNYYAAVVEGGEITIWVYHWRPSTTVGNITRYPGPYRFSIPIRSYALLFATILGYVIARPRLIRYRRRKRGQCIKCGYDLTGNTSGVCPECGCCPLPLPKESSAQDSVGCKPTS